MRCQLASAASLLGNLLLARKSWEQALCYNDHYWSALEGLCTVLFTLEDFYGKVYLYHVRERRYANYFLFLFSLPPCYLQRIKIGTKLSKRWIFHLLYTVSCEYFVVKVFSDNLAYYVNIKHSKTYAHFYGNVVQGQSHKVLYTCTCTVPLQKRAHGRCTLHWAKIGGWTNIRGISIAFRRKRAPR